MNLEINKLDKKTLRNFGLITGAIVLVLFGLFLPWVFSHKLPYWPWVLTGILWGLAMLSPLALTHVYRIWMRIGNGLGWINSRIILGIMFYVIFLPSGIIMKLLGKDPMTRSLNKKQITTNRSIPHLPKKSKLSLIVFSPLVLLRLHLRFFYFGNLNPSNILQ